MYSIIKTIYINRKINIGVPEKRELFGERRNDEMSELMTFSLSNKKSRHERYAVRDDVVEMAVIARFAPISGPNPHCLYKNKNKISGSLKSVSFLGKGGTTK